MNVLSLFDGISCGQIALERAGIQVDKYFASEIDEEAMKVTQYHHPNTIQLGDVKNVSCCGRLPQMDLLMGGSPCQGFSVNGTMLNFNDKRSALFFEFLNILKKIKPKYFLLENVKMKRTWVDLITHFIGCDPVEINSKVCSKQNRKRLYWTNIDIPEFDPCDLKFNDYLYKYPHGFVEDKIDFYEHYPTLTTLNPGASYRMILDINKARKATKEQLKKKKFGVTRQATPEECEEFQTLPIGYTKVIKKVNSRYRCIGNGWTVDVVANILKGIK